MPHPEAPATKRRRELDHQCPEHAQRLLAILMRFEVSAGLIHEDLVQVCPDARVVDAQADAHVLQQVLQRALPLRAVDLDFGRVDLNGIPLLNFRTVTSTTVSGPLPYGA